MPEKEIKARGGATTYRTIKRGDKVFTCAIVRKSGPKGGRSVCWEKGSKPR